MRARHLRLTSACVALAVSFGATATARASDGVTLEAGFGQSKPTPTIAASLFEYQKLVGRWEPSDRLYFNLQLRLQRDFDGAAVPGTTLVTGSDWVGSGSLDATFDVSSHVSLSAGFFASPNSSRDVASPFDLAVGKASQTSTALVHTGSSYFGGTATASYGSASDDGPERPVDLSLDASVGYTAYVTEQAITMLDSGGGPSTVDAIAKGCVRSTPLCQAVSASSIAASQSLGQLRLGTTVTTTLYQHTDLSLDGGYYVYDSGSPDNVGFYTAPLVNAAGTKGAAKYGAGLTLLPPRWALRPEISQTAGIFTARAWYQLTEYTSPDFVGHGVGGKVQLRLGPRVGASWRLYGTGSYRVDVASSSGAANPGNAQSWTLGLGLTRAF